MEFVAQWVGQQVSEAVGPGSSLCRVIYFSTSLTFVRISNCSHGTLGRRTGFRNGGYRFDSQPLPIFFNFFNMTGNRDTHPFLCKRSFESKIFLKPGRVPLRNISVLWEKRTSKKMWHPYYPKKINSRTFPKHSGRPKKVVSTMRQKNFEGKRDPPPL